MHKGSKVINKIHSAVADMLRLAAVAGVAGVAAAASGSVAAQPDRKPMTCKLSSEKVVGGREKQCLYVCEDKSIEGRSRAPSSSCPGTVQSGGR
jgi:hypothetical protein